MSDKISKESRRKLLKSIAAGSGVVIAGKSLPEKWAKPVIESVMLPAHAQASPACCEGVFCDLDFGLDPVIAGSAQVSSDCTIIMGGDSEGGIWSGSGTVAADGSFSFTVNFASVPPGTATGTVAPGCVRISGTVVGIAFSGPVSQGLTSIAQCED